MYELSRNRYKELKHFCLQYPEMKEKLLSLEGQETADESDPTGRIATTKADLSYALWLIETTANDIGKFPAEKILEIVTEDRCIGEVCPDVATCAFYLRKFFFLLSKRKGV